MATAVDESKSVATTRAALPATREQSLGAQQSTSGTPRFGPLSRPDDYVIELADPVHRMQVFEEMRLSDDAVQSALDARTKMITSSNWRISAVDDTPAARETAAFAEDNIYPILDNALRWLGGGALHYGFGLCEPVYAYADAPAARNIVRGGKGKGTGKYGRRIYLAKLAHVRQRTIWSFMLSPTGDIDAIRQYAYNGYTFAQKDLDPSRMLLHTYNREGDDFWGIPPTRHVYKAWTFKTQIERLNILGIDRFGVGTPVGEGGPSWEDADFKRLDQYLENWRSGSNTYLVHPAGGKITIVSGDGTLTMALKAWVEYYNLAITKAFYTQGSELGSTQTGARALGETMLEQAETMVQSDDEALASLLNEKLIVPLIDMNFGPQDEYPRFVPSQRVRASSALFTAIQGFVTAHGLTWGAEDEAWLRDAMELPERPIEELQASYDAKAQQAQAAANAAVAAAKNPTATTVQSGAKEPTVRATPPQREVTRTNPTTQLSRPVPTSAPTPAVRGESWRNPEFTTWEAGVLKPEILSRDLNLQQTRLAAEVQDAVRGVDSALVEQVATYAAQGLPALTAAIKRIAVPAGARSKLRAVLARAAERSRIYGANAVKTEAARQDTSGSAPTPTRADDTATNATTATSSIDTTPKRAAQISAEVDRAVEDEVSRREAAARSGALYAIHLAGDTTTSDQLASTARAQAQSNLEELSTFRTEDNVGGVVNVGFGAGRIDAADTMQSDIAAKVYSAVMDGGTCDECQKWDGATFPPDYPEDATGVQAPNPNCDGSLKRCRCVFVYITSDEVPSAVPGSKGPVVAGFPY